MPPVPSVTVVVVSWNTAALLDACLAALRADADSGLAQVIVVDNASDDGSADLVAGRHPWATLIRAGGNIGYGRAVNLGAADAVGSGWLVAANADVAVRPGALQALVDAGDADPGVGVLAPRLLLPGGDTQHHVHPFPSLRTLAALHLRAPFGILPAGRLMEGRWAPEADADVDWAHGALLLIRRGPFDAIGGFAQDRWLYAEDVDLCWRMARAGWRTRYVANARVTHAVSAATRQAWSDDGLRDAHKQAATYAWMRQAYGARRTALLAGAAWAGASAQAARSPKGWRRDRARAHAGRHAAGLRTTLRGGRGAG